MKLREGLMNSETLAMKILEQVSWRKEGLHLRVPNVVLLLMAGW